MCIAFESSVINLIWIHKRRLTINQITKWIIKIWIFGWQNAKLTKWRGTKENCWDQILIKVRFFLYAKVSKLWPQKSNNFRRLCFGSNNICPKHHLPYIFLWVLLNIFLHHYLICVAKLAKVLVPGKSNICKQLESISMGDNLKVVWAKFSTLS